MKKIYLMTAMAIAMMFTACSSSEDGVEVDNPKTPVLAQKVPVGFNAYAERGTTRSGLAGDLVIDQLRKTKANGGGFGVFAYYTDLKKYDQTYVPNFMYNQGVFWNGEDGNAGSDTWVYSPMMYWPNESGSDAQSDDEDKVTFFAYAPYVEHSSGASGSVADATYGITGFSRNSTAGDPIVKYIASFDASESVDLCWGVCSDATWAKFQGTTDQTMTAGLPWLDVEHPQGIDQKMTFTFKHALAQLNVQIDADPDVADHDETSDLKAGTKIYVRSISFTGIAMKGALNLNNPVANTARWLDYSGTTDLPYGESVTVKDGRRDGREGATGAEANNELPAGLNPQIVQNSTATTGVTKSLQNLFAAAALTTPVCVIPTGEAMTVTIVYDVETASPDLTTYLSDGVTHGSSIENRISKTITWSSGTGLQSGKKYTLQLHLGMNSVKFNAEVGEWDPTAITGNAWLPKNDTCTGTDLTSATVGQIICSHGKAHAATTGALSCGGTKVAIVAYKGSAGSADTSTGSDSYVGLAIAMADVSSTHQWYTESSGTCITNGQNSDIATAIGMSDDFGKGIDNTNRLATAACGSGHVHAAAQAAVGYESTVAHPSGTSQWFLPTMYQWNLMVKAMTGKSTDLTITTNNDYMADQFNTKITAAGGTGVQAGVYWSSVESNTSNAWYMLFNYGYAYYYDKSNVYYVRPVLAF